MLKFGKGNAKLGKKVHTFSLPAGYSCPFAHECLSKVKIVNGKRKVVDGPHTKHRCYAASLEALYPTVYKLVRHNMEALVKAQNEGGKDALIELIAASLPKDVQNFKPDTYVRVHTDGDFFSQLYFDAWMAIAAIYPNTLFYAYTKSLRYWLDYRKRVGGRQRDMPRNFVLTASYGGRDDRLIKKHRLRSALVVHSVEQAESLGLEIDHDDSHAMKQGGDFALLIHGTQPAGTEAAKALKKLNGLGSYGRGTKGGAK